MKLCSTEEDVIWAFHVWKKLCLMLLIHWISSDLSFEGRWALEHILLCWSSRLTDKCEREKILLGGSETEAVWDWTLPSLQTSSHCWCLCQNYIEAQSGCVYFKMGAFPGPWWLETKCTNCGKKASVSIFVESVYVCLSHFKIQHAFVD